MISINLILITGAPGAGKSSVSRALAKRLPKSTVISGDDIRELVIGGFKSPADHWTDEHRMQYYLSFENEAAVAKNFIRNGFKVIIEDVIHTTLIDKWNEYFQDIPNEKFLLSPSKDVILHRNKTRDKHLVEQIIHTLFPHMSPEKYPSWHVIDSSNQTIDETADEIQKILKW